MLYREIMAVCSQIHTKHINTLCGQNVELLNVKPSGTKAIEAKKIKKESGGKTLPVRAMKVGCSQGKSCNNFYPLHELEVSKRFEEEED